MNPPAPRNNEREIPGRRGACHSTGLAARKQLLLAESELNRAQLAQEWRIMADEVHSLASRAKNIGSLASVAALIAGLVIFRRRKSPPAITGNKSSWLQTILKGAGRVASLWRVFHPNRRVQNGY